jgi:hypothetical protein
MDWPSQYHAILGRPTFAKFMAVPHYAYLAFKIPGPKWVITVQGSFEVSNTCDKEFNRLAQTFGMTAEYARLKGETDHNVLLTSVDPCQIRLLTQHKILRKFGFIPRTPTRLLPS